MIIDQMYKNKSSKNDETDRIVSVREAEGQIDNSTLNENSDIFTDNSIYNFKIKPHKNVILEVKENINQN